VAYRRLLGLQVGRGTVFLESISIRGRGNVYERVRIGRNCGLRDCTFFANAPITIGDGVWISMDTLVTTDTHLIGAASERRGRRLSLPVIIGDGCWITQGSTVHAGATIGAGTILSNRGAVVRDLPANHLAGGNPALPFRALEG